jgi:hypothetical protein
MSFPSVTTFLQDQGVTADTATNEQLQKATLSAFYQELPLGMAHLESLALETNRRSAKWIDVNDPGSPLGQQLARLVGTDAARPLVSQHFGTAFGFYNCCNVVCAPVASQLDLSLREQVKLQNGDLAYADC